LAGPDIECIFVQAPGREARLREMPIASVLETADRLAIEIAPWLDRPYAIFGHSLGGMVAFELVRRIRAHQLPPPQRLFVSATRAPQLPNPYPALRDLPDLQLLLEVNARYANSVPAEVLRSADLHALFVPALRADLAALETYEFRPEPPLACPISAFHGAADPTVQLPAVEAWSAHSTAPLRVRTVDGPHLYLHPSRRLLMDAVRTDLGLVSASPQPVHVL
jgi:medium-chain acyl-[acyl-carrier-protein] hydrolase